MTNQGDIKNDILVQLGVSTTVAFYTDAILDDWIDKAHKWTAGYKKWPFTEGKVSTTYVSSQVDGNGDIVYNYPEGWKPDSIRLIQIGGQRLRKLNFYKYQEFREDFPNDSKKVYTDHGRLYYINPMADVSGTITVWGQYTPATLDATDLTAETVFSSAEEGNEALIEEVMSYAKKKEKKLQESITHHEKAKQILEELWSRIKDEQFAYHDGDNDGMFERFDVLEGDYHSDLIRRNRWY